MLPAMTSPDRTAETEIHPVQWGSDVSHRDEGLPEAVTRRAYEVYCHTHGPQPAMVDLKGRGCRGGFGVAEIVAFLYARSFPKEEWECRVTEAWPRKLRTAE